MQLQSNVCIANYDFTSDSIKTTFTRQQSNSKPSMLIKFTVGLLEECLITHLIIKFSEQHLLKHFTLISLENQDMLEDGTLTFNRMLNSKDILLNQDIKITGLGISNKVRLTFAISDVLDKDSQKNSDGKTQESKLKNKFQSIQVCGYQLYQTPVANQMVPLLNISHIFKKNQKEMYGAQADILLGLSLLSSRRFIQAAEIFRKVAICLAEKASLSRKKEQQFFRASSLQLLVADSINQPSMLNEKLQSLKIAIIYMNQSFPQEAEMSDQYGLFNLHNPDSYECMLRLSEGLIKIISRVLLIDDDFDALRMANLRCLEFLIEQVGCNLGDQIIQILKLFIKMYCKSQPNNIMEMMTKITNMLIQELGQATLKLIQDVWTHIIVDGIQEITNDGQKFIVKLCESLLLIEYANYKIDIPFLKQLHQSNDDKLWQLILMNVVPKQTDKKQLKIISWVTQQLTESLNFTNYNNLTQLQQSNIIKLLQLIQVIIRSYKEDQQMPLFDNYLNKQLNNCMKIRNLYIRPNFTLISLKPILIKLLDQSVSGKISFDCFQLVWDCLMEILIDAQEEDQIYDLAFPFLQNIFDIIKNSSPNIDLLIILLHILETIQQQCPQVISKLDTKVYHYLELFSLRVPHSIYDETFKIFDILLQFCIDLLDCSLIEKCVMALLDQYTVKGQAQKCSKANLIRLALLNNAQLFSLVQICLIQNYEPAIFVAQTKNKDSKQLYQDYELFIEKTQFACELFVELSQQFKFTAILIQANKDFQQSLINLIISQNSKIRGKAYQILQCIMDGYIQSDQATRVRVLEDQFSFIEFIISIVVYTLQNKQDQRCLLNALILLSSSFTIKFLKSDNQRLLKLIYTCWGLVTDLIETSNNGIQTLIFEILNTWCQLLNKIQNSDQFDEFIEQIFSWAQEQLDCQEQWHQYNILKLCGYLFGLDIGKNFRKYPQIPITYWELVYGLQGSQNKQLQLMAIVLTQICAPEQIAMKMMTQYAEQYTLRKHKLNKQRDVINKQADYLIHSLLVKSNSNRESIQQSETFGSSSIEESEINHQELLWMRKIDSEQLAQCLQTLFTYQQQQESKLKQSDIFDKETDMKQSNPGQTQQQNKNNILDDDPLDFDELGIIEVDDEEWNEYDDLRKIPVLKDRMKTTSPSIGKPQNNNVRTNQQEQRQGGQQNNQQRNYSDNVDYNNQERKQDKYIIEDQLLKTLRPHNQVFRPLTPPIGQQTHSNDILNDVRLVSDFMMQNPLSFQKIIQEIKNNGQNNEEQQEEQQNQQQQQHIQQSQNEQQFSQQSNDQQQQQPQNQFESSYARRVDELEFDPQFSHSSQEFSDNLTTKQLQQQKKKKHKKLLRNSSELLKTKKDSNRNAINKQQFNSESKQTKKSNKLS